MKKQRMKMAALALFLAAAGLAGCGKSSETAAMQERAVMETQAGAYENELSGPGAELSADTSPAGGLTDPADSNSKSAELPAGRKLIRTIDMGVETDNFDSLLAQVSDKIKALGGYVEQSDIAASRASRQNESQPRYAHITARIPADRLDSFITAVEEKGNVIEKSENTADVTLQYSDIESRKKSLSIEQERIWSLLEKADTLESVITLEERLSEIRYELEKMESQLRLYDNQVEYSSISMRINEVTAFTPTAPESVGQRIQDGFSRNLDGISGALLNLIIAIISGSPIWIPIAVITLLLLYFLRVRQKKEMLKKLPDMENWDKCGETDNTIAEEKKKDGKIEDRKIKNSKTENDKIEDGKIEDGKTEDGKDSGNKKGGHINDK